ncbi:sugar phosphate isomerase/epimerase [Saccharothrix violaceirubra]|uniref:Methylmalonyl-CoA mutase cobalamin-binding subunit n=1 Tax=Saccharothrix violaceirubra TaxID=413306 RepID=A0A7W7WVG7_9PSEU|nr:TIM barrel protein [Saccharothrix violaceirubra]MBB4965041.1 methylmalonyl-CoA mutase cobalamin-binding subunit [Saccharothrix violaceirubra]
MINPGVASVTFRGRPVGEVAALAADAGLSLVEWAGDVHVPAGDLYAAVRAAEATRAHGLAVGTYGSYYKAGQGEDVTPVLDSAQELGAPRVRVWGGVKGSADTTPAERAAVTDDLRRCVDLAAERGLAVLVEHHVESLTDTLDSARRLLADVPALVPHWQPRESPDVEECLAEVRALRPVSVHAFSWGDDGFTERLPLGAREDLWRPLLSGYEGDVLLEFVPDDSPEAFRRDAATLLAWSEDAR